MLFSPDLIVNKNCFIQNDINTFCLTCLYSLKTSENFTLNIKNNLLKNEKTIDHSKFFNKVEVFC